MKKAFLFCGLTGWCMEVLWTGLHSVLSGELTMTGKTSLLMFPIYGCAASSAHFPKFSTFPSFVRGCIYSVGIFFVDSSVAHSYVISICVHGTILTPL